MARPLRSAITELRKSYGESQAKFARRIPAAAGTVARWEHGQNRPTLGYLDRLYGLAVHQKRFDLAEIFQEAVNDIFGFDVS